MCTADNSAIMNKEHAIQHVERRGNMVIFECGRVGAGQQTTENKRLRIGLGLRLR